MKQTNQDTNQDTISLAPVFYEGRYWEYATSRKLLLKLWEVLLSSWTVEDALGRRIDLIFEHSSYHTTEAEAACEAMRLNILLREEGRP